MTDMSITNGYIELMSKYRYPTKITYLTNKNAEIILTDMDTQRSNCYALGTDLTPLCEWKNGWSHVVGHVWFQNRYEKYNILMPQLLSSPPRPWSSFAPVYITFYTHRQYPVMSTLINTQSNTPGYKARQCGLLGLSILDFPKRVITSPVPYTSHTLDVVKLPLAVLPLNMYLCIYRKCSPQGKCPFKIIFPYLLY